MSVNDKTLAFVKKIKNEVLGDHSLFGTNLTHANILLSYYYRSQYILGIPYVCPLMQTALFKMPKHCRKDPFVRNVKLDQCFVSGLGYQLHLDEDTRRRILVFSRYLRYAMGVYGLLVIFIDSGKVSNLFNSCFKVKGIQKEANDADNKSYGCLRSFLEKSKTDIEDILLYSFNKDYELANFVVCKNPEENSIVIAVQGTHYMRDIATNLMIERSPLDRKLFLDVPDDCYAHKGILTVSIEVFKRIMRNKQTKEQLKNKKYEKIVFIGHSLGAGIATILSLLVRSFLKKKGHRYDHIECVAISPSKIFSLDLASCDVVKKIVSSIVIESDIVSRLSIEGMRRVLNKMRVLVNLERRSFVKAYSSHRFFVKRIENIKKDFHYRCLAAKCLGNFCNRRMNQNYESIAFGLDDCFRRESRSREKLALFSTREWKHRLRIYLDIESKLNREFIVQFLKAFCENDFNEDMPPEDLNNLFIKTYETVEAKIENSSLEYVGQEMFLPGRILHISKSKHGVSLSSHYLCYNHIQKENHYCIFEADPLSFKEICFSRNSLKNHMIWIYKKAAQYLEEEISKSNID